MTHHVTLLPGDTTGAEIFEHVKPLLVRLGVDITWDEPTPTATMETLLASVRRTGTALMAYEWGDRDSGKLAPIVVLREELGVYANLRPLRSLPSVPSRHRDVDLLVVRETTEDIYAHLEHESLPGVFESFKVTTEVACERIARYAFETARRLGRAKVTIVHKANIMKLSDGMFLRVGRQVSEEYPEIETNDCIVDALCMKLIMNPGEFDVLLCGNLFGDIVADLCTGIVGGASNAPSINIADDVVLFTAGHGDSMNLVGTGKGNPLTLLLPTIAMLSHLGEGDAAARLETAMNQAIEGGTRPFALGGQASVTTFFVALLAHI
jgi:isocitrate dehydrogenase (NAD+)